MRRFFVLICCFVMLLLTTGCVGNKYGSAYIVSSPPGAEVINLDDGTLLGVTPFKQIWRDAGDRKFISIQLDKQGYKDKATSFWLTLDHRTRRSAVNDPQYIEVKLDSKSANNGSTDNGSTNEDTTNALE